MVSNSVAQLRQTELAESDIADNDGIVLIEVQVDGWRMTWRIVVSFGGRIVKVWRLCEVDR
jgi:hypothetical protein